MANQLDPAGTEPQAILAAADFSGARVLEIGSGNGRLTFRFAAAARAVIGVDLKHADVAFALQRCPERLRMAVRFASASAILLPFRNTSFDIALFASALWWVAPEGMVDALREARRVLIPGGIMLDLRPISEQNLVEIVAASGVAVPYGKIDAYGAAEEDRAADHAIEHALGQRWFIRESGVKFDVESYWDSAAELNTFARCSRRLREAKISADDIEERRLELGSPEAPARVRFHRTMMLNRYSIC